MSETIILAIIGGIVAGVGWIWILITAFRESTSQGLLCIMPFYAVYYAINRWSDTRTPIVISLVGVGFALLIVGVVFSLMQFYEVKAVITKFMEAGAARDVEAAYACWSPWSSATEKEEIDEFIESNCDVFIGYKRLTIHQRIEKSIDGITVCPVSGDIVYTGAGDPRLSFYASLRKDNYGCWKIVNIRIGNIQLGITPYWYYGPPEPHYSGEKFVSKNVSKRSMMQLF